MARRIVEAATGPVDGVNSAFRTGTDYRPGSMTVQVNGQQLPPADVSELGGRDFTLASPPKTPGIITVRYTAVT